MYARMHDCEECDDTRDHTLMHLHKVISERRALVELRVSFEASTFCCALLLIASGLTGMALILPVLAAGCYLTAMITPVHWICASCFFELPASGRKFHLFVVKRFCYMSSIEY